MQQKRFLILCVDERYYFSLQINSSTWGLSMCQLSRVLLWLILEPKTGYAEFYKKKNFAPLVREVDRQTLPPEPLLTLAYLSKTMVLSFVVRFIGH